MKGKSSSKSYSSFKTKLGLLFIFLICTFFFLPGLYCSTLFLQNELADGDKARSRFLESLVEDRVSNFWNQWKDETKDTTIDIRSIECPVQLREFSEEELKQYDGFDSNKFFLMAIKGQIYDICHSSISSSIPSPTKPSRKIEMYSFSGILSCVSFTWLSHLLKIDLTIHRKAQFLPHYKFFPYSA